MLLVSNLSLSLSACFKTSSLSNLLNVFHLQHMVCLVHFTVCILQGMLKAHWICPFMPLVLPVFACTLGDQHSLSFRTQQLRASDVRFAHDFMSICGPHVPS